MTRTLAKLLDRADEVLALLSAGIDECPDPGNIAVPNERYRIETLLTNLRACSGRITSAAHTCRNPKPAWDLRPLKAWRDTLLDAKRHFVEKLSALAARG